MKFRHFERTSEILNTSIFEVTGTRLVFDKEFNLMYMYIGGYAKY